MSTEKLKTISEIAKELGVSRQAIHQKIKKDTELSTALQSYLTTVNNVVYISNEGESLIKSALTKNQNKGDLQVGLQSVVYSLQSKIDSLQGDLHTKNNEIEMLKQQLLDKKAETEKYNAELSEERNKAVNLNAEIKAKQSEIDTKNSEIDILNSTIETFKQQLENKDKQIADANTALLLSQQLHAADKQKLLSIEEKTIQAEPTQEHKLTLWERLTGKGRKQ